MTRASIRNMLLASALALPLIPSAALAHDHDEHAGLTAGQAQGKFGQVNFPVSCGAAAQKQFNQAVAILHSFWYEEALASFKAVADSDPGCAMAYWGQAMSVWYPLWYPPSEASLKAGADAVAKAREIGAKTDRERAYIDAIGAFYQDWDKRDHRTRSLAYEKAMEQVHLAHPDDREAAVFYALALLATALPTDRTYANQKKAGAILERVFAVEPDHPGVAHYLIHSYDNPSLAERGLPAARQYAAIAPAVPHALHMPSHIFTRLGLWQESIASNRAAEEAGQAFAAKQFGPGVLWDESLHAMDYSEYAYLQTGQDREAKAIVATLSAYQKAAPGAVPAAFALVAIPARYAVERRDWQAAAALSRPPVALDWSRFPWLLALVTYARGLGAAHTGDLDAARAELASLQSVPNAVGLTKSAYWTDQVEVQRRSIAAAIARAEGRREDALALMRSAAELEAVADKAPATPGAVAPARELLGDMLFDMGQPAQALAEYERSLATAPNRYRGLAGAARAAQQVGDAEKARTYYQQLVRLCPSAESDRPELAAARQYLAKG
ncbi:MAG TPA: hypothetical protein VJ779_20085 [Acetobacteraceae bacterium]|nr:hypothetical protein [Acetobacteraceae bacterium]